MDDLPLLCIGVDGVVVEEGDLGGGLFFVEGIPAVGAVVADLLVGFDVGVHGGERGGGGDGSAYLLIHDALRPTDGVRVYSSGWGFSSAVATMNPTCDPDIPHMFAAGICSRMLPRACLVRDQPCQSPAVTKQRCPIGMIPPAPCCIQLGRRLPKEATAASRKLH